ncbi:hypothetical protein NE237_016243 [Protea cynaroides]|uniref:Uncharacterized protein n=1 Tax=Protea cynaroides TaxID=273540 RepID=A0A9Q0KFG8_9MAGN|nr:hypothetical protein NE237_016243 [Protea cynaroides]
MVRSQKIGPELQVADSYVGIAKAGEVVESPTTIYQITRNQSTGRKTSRAMSRHGRTRITFMQTVSLSIAANSNKIEKEEDLEEIPSPTREASRIRNKRVMEHGKYANKR